MDDLRRIGASIRAVRVKRGWTQQELARRAVVPRSVVSLVERWHLAEVAIGKTLAIAKALDIRISMRAWWRAGDLDRLLNGHHSLLLVIELKTDIVDVNELVGTLDRKRRLASQIAQSRGWDADIVSCWVVVALERTSRRRIEAHRTMPPNAFPLDGRSVRAWLRDPVGSVARSWG